MKVLVTGGSGFLGSHLVGQLIGRGDRVRVFCRGHHPVFDRSGVEWRAGDLRDARAVRDACRDVDIVFHVAAKAGIWGPLREFFEVNVEGTRHVIGACREQGVAKLIYTSSPSVVFDGRDHEHADESLPYPENYLCAYPQTKAVAEREVLAANNPPELLTVSLRPHLIFGPGDRHLIPRLIDRARKGRLRRVGDGTNRISVSYVENVAAAHIQAADALTADSPLAGRAYFICEPEPVRLWDFVDELLRRAGLDPLSKSISARNAWRAGCLLERVYRWFRLPGEPPMTRFLALQLSRSHWYDVSRAERDFGYRPLVSMQEALERTEPELRRLAEARLS